MEDDSGYLGCWNLGWLKGGGGRKWGVELNMVGDQPCTVEGLKPWVAC